MDAGQAAHLSGQMSGQAVQMNQVGRGGVGVGGADGLPQHQPMQNAVSLDGIDAQFVMLRNSMRERILEYIGRKQSSAQWRRRLPELARRLEDILFKKFSSKNDYYNMMKGQIEPHLQFAIKTLSAQNQQNHQTPRQTASSSGYCTMIPTPGMTQGSSGNTRIPYVTDNNALSSSGGGMVPQNANMGTSMQAALRGVSESVLAWPAEKMDVGQAAHLSGQMSGQAVQMNQVGGSAVSVGGADRLPQHQPMQDAEPMPSLLEYIGKKQSSAEWRRRLPELARRLEDILFKKFSNKNDYYNMMKGRIEPHLQFAIKTLSAQNQQNHQTPRQTASSSGYCTMIPPGMTQGSSGNTRIPYVTENNALSSSGAGMVPQNANMGTSMQASSSRTVYAGADHLKKELYQMNETLKERYLEGLSDLYEISKKLHVDNHIASQKPTNQHEEVKSFKSMLERSLHSLQINKSCDQPYPEKNVPTYKRKITSILNSEEWKPEKRFQQSAGQALVEPGLPLACYQQKKAM
ncbi:hypothetical protein EJB05_14635 [Eragrostis curvula]|uniref:Mediator complex subunit 15 KIX domain-containing protein n=1 Tax=Eragrostis curvula TaxID=38414 RepID=A0A5J9VY13_9POAL|nr:hypothetical protein EJB05_14635 [Eragrostis curvula]